MFKSALFALAIVACHTPDPPAVEPPLVGDAAVAGDCASACRRLRMLACPEGNVSPNGLSCENVCARASALRTAPLACWANAASRDSAIACGGIRCAP